MLPTIAPLLGHVGISAPRGRWTLSALALAVAFGCGGEPRRVTQHAEPLPPSPWGQFRGTALHAGDASARPTPAWRVRWSAELGERIDASPVIAGDGRVVVATRAGSVVALDQATGVERRRARLSAGVWASPALVGDTLVVAAKDARVYGLDARTFDTVWTRRVPSVWSSGIAAARGIVYVASGAALLALDATDGTVVWRRGTGARIARAVAVDVDRDIIVGGNRAGHVLAFHLDGRPRWDAATSTGAHNDGPATIAGELVLVGSNDRHLYAYAVDGGASVWVSRSGSWVVSSAAYADGAVYTGDDGGRLRRLDAATGTIRWSTQVGDDLASSPTVVGDLVVHGAHDGKLWAHDTRTGVSLDPIDAGAPVFASPAVGADGSVAMATHAGRVIVVE